MIIFIVPQTFNSRNRRITGQTPARPDVLLPGRPPLPPRRQLQRDPGQLPVPRAQLPTRRQNGDQQPGRRPQLPPEQLRRSGGGAGRPERHQPAGQRVRRRDLLRLGGRRQLQPAQVHVRERPGRWREVEAGREHRRHFGQRHRPGYHRSGHRSVHQGAPGVGAEHTEGVGKSTSLTGRCNTIKLNSS